MQRRALALALIAAGVALNWGPGWALLTAGAGLLVAGVDPAPIWHDTRRSATQAVARIRVVAAGHPRRTAASGLVTVAVVLLPVAALTAAGAAAGLGVLGAIAGGLGAFLGWE